ncbi:MAG: hypothetical protein ACYTFY_12115, partial [Planctomycetota bacterium]
EIKSIWQTADHKGFCGINFIFKNDSEMRQIKSQIAAIIYPDRKTTDIEEQHKKEISSARFKARTSTK